VKTKKEYSGKSRRERKYRVLDFYSEGKLRCEICGYEDMRALTLDHVNGGGNKQRKLLSSVSTCVAASGTAIYAWIEHNNYPEGFRILCMNCQFVQRYEKLGYSTVKEI